MTFARVAIWLLKHYKIESSMFDTDEDVSDEVRSTGGKLNRGTPSLSQQGPYKAP